MENIELVTYDGLNSNESKAIETVRKIQICINKDYLTSLSESELLTEDKFSEYHVDEEKAGIYLIQLDKITYAENEKTFDKLKTVYQTLANKGSFGMNTVAFIIDNQKNEGCRLYLAIKSSTDETISTCTALMNSLKGNFPGINFVQKGNEKNIEKKYHLNKKFKNLENNESNPLSVGVISNIASDFSENYLSQGIEKFIDACSGYDYTLILMAKSCSDLEIEKKKEVLYYLASRISPFVKQNMNWSVSDSDTKGFCKNIGSFTSVNAGWNLGPSIGVSLGFSGNLGWNKSQTNTKQEGHSIEVVDYKLKHIIDVAEKQIQRLDQCSSLGMWDFAGYVFTREESSCKSIANMYLSLTQGKESYYEKSALNFFSSQKAINIASQIERLEHPIFKKELSFDPIKSDEDSIYVTACSTLSTSELARAMYLPQKSVSGFTVMKSASFGRKPDNYLGTYKGDLPLGKVYHMHQVEKELKIDLQSLTSHVFVTGTTGSGKSNTVYRLISEIKERSISEKGKNKIRFMVIEPAKGEYKNVFGLDKQDVTVYGTNNINFDNILALNPFVFNKEIHIYEHIDRLIEIFNVCWPMYAAMPAVLKEAVIRAYQKCGWDLINSQPTLSHEIFPTFRDVCQQIDSVIKESSYSNDTKGDYIGSLKTRLNDLTNGITGLIFNGGNISDTDLFEKNVIIDLSRVSSAETKSLIMGFLIIRCQEYRMSKGKMNSSLTHVTVLEEAHNLLKGQSVSSGEQGHVLAKSVEMISNAIAEMRTYGEGFIIADQAPGLLDESVIRNTNTKIIMRLPDEKDRILVGRSAGLNDEQIDELSRLEKGVAAVYQNDWIEPVLCKIDKYEGKEDKYSCERKPISLISEEDIKSKITITLFDRKEKWNQQLVKEILSSDLLGEEKVFILDYVEGSEEYKKRQKMKLLCWSTDFKTKVLNYYIKEKGITNNTELKFQLEKLKSQKEEHDFLYEKIIDDLVKLDARQESQRRQMFDLMLEYWQSDYFAKQNNKRIA